MAGGWSTEMRKQCYFQRQRDLYSKAERANIAQMSGNLRLCGTYKIGCLCKKNGLGMVDGGTHRTFLIFKTHCYHYRISVHANSSRSSTYFVDAELFIIFIFMDSYVKLFLFWVRRPC